MDAGPEAERGPAWGGCRPGGRLDMSHGFVRHIRRNQIARSRLPPPWHISGQGHGIYVPALCTVLCSAVEPQGLGGNRTPATNAYSKQDAFLQLDENGRADPACSLEYEGSSESSSSTEPDPRGIELFCLEYEADSGEVTSVIVHQDDSPEEVTEKVCARSPLEPPLREALRQRVQEELRKRRAKR